MVTTKFIKAGEQIVGHKLFFEKTIKFSHLSSGTRMAIYPTLTCSDVMAMSTYYLSLGAGKATQPMSSKFALTL